MKIIIKNQNTGEEIFRFTLSTTPQLVAQEIIKKIKTDFGLEFKADDLIIPKDEKSISSVSPEAILVVQLSNEKANLLRDRIPSGDPATWNLEIMTRWLNKLDASDIKIPPEVQNKTGYALLLLILKSAGKEKRTQLLGSFYKEKSRFQNPDLFELTVKLNTIFKSLFDQKILGLCPSKGINQIHAVIFSNDKDKFRIGDTNDLSIIKYILKNFQNIDIKSDTHSGGGLTEILITSTDDFANFIKTASAMTEVDWKRKIAKSAELLKKYADNLLGYLNQFELSNDKNKNVLISAAATTTHKTIIREKKSEEKMVQFKELLETIDQHPPSIAFEKLKSEREEVIKIITTYKKRGGGMNVELIDELNFDYDNLMNNRLVASQIKSMDEKVSNLAQHSAIKAPPPAQQENASISYPKSKDSPSQNVKK